MILILLVGLALFGFEKVVPCYQLKDCTCETPHIGGFIVLRANENLWRAVLASLNDVRELIVNIASISHVHNFNSKLHIYHLLYILFI